MTMKPPSPQQPQDLFNAPPPWQGESNRIDVNLIAMLLWQSLLTGTAVAVSHLDWYLPQASSGEMGIQYGLVTFGFLCSAMVLFQIGGIRDSLAMRAEFSQETRYDKWLRQQMQMQARRMQKQQYYTDLATQIEQQTGQQPIFGLPNDGSNIQQDEEQVQ